MANCPVCGSRIRDWAPSCPSCGVSLEWDQALTKQTWADEAYDYDDYGERERYDNRYDSQRGHRYRTQRPQRSQATWPIIGGLIAALFACVCVCCFGLVVVEILLSEEETPRIIAKATPSIAATPLPITPPYEEAPAPEVPIPTREPIPPPAATIYQIGDVIGVGDMVMVVLGWGVPLGDEFNKPDEGKKFVAVDVLLVNQSNDTASVSSFLQMGLKDGTGQQYDVDLTAGAAAGSASPDGEMAPGERLRGKVGFQVAQDAAGLVFVFDANIFGTGKVFVELGPNPVALEPPAELAGEKAQTMFAIGDIVEIDDVVLVVLGWDSPAGDEFSSPEEGKEFVVVDLILVNQSDSAASVSSMLQMELKDDTGQQYDVDMTASVASGSDGPDGELAPGERVRGKVGFQVPNGIGRLTFVFDAEVWGTGKVFVDLGANPIAVEVPAGLPGERAQQMFAIGDVVTIGDFAIVVNSVTSPQGDEFNRPEEGYKFIVVDVSVTNNSSEIASLSSLMQMSLKDSTGQVYDLDLTASVASGGTTPDGEIVPGEMIRGQIGYQVPENATGLVFVFDADVWGAGKAFVALP